MTDKIKPIPVDFEIIHPDDIQKYTKELEITDVTYQSAAEKLRELNKQILQKKQKPQNNQREQKTEGITFISYCPRCKQQHMFFEYKCMTCGLPYDCELRKINTRKAVKQCGIIFDIKKIICKECGRHKICEETKNNWNGQGVQQ